MISAMNALKLKVLDEGLMIRFTPHHEVSVKCIEYGRNFGMHLLKGE